VVYVDLTEEVLEGVGKFVTYALFPDSVYSVVVGLLKNGPKISVGYNPWSGRPLDTDISSICARYGGGGHPVVGGIAFANSEVDRARAVARQIADELMG
jgi:nanoRNase/pAp phosphatase (c-di-AMP/oligoRNAs hydrolase)